MLFFKLYVVVHLSYFFVPSSFSGNHGNSTNSVSGGGGLSPTIQVPTWGVSAAGAAVPTAPSLSDVNSTDSPVAPGMDACRARVLYDYDAADIKELSLIADEVGSWACYTNWNNFHNECSCTCSNLHLFVELNLD